MKNDDWFGRVYRMKLSTGGERLMMAITTPKARRYGLAPIAYFVVVSSDDAYGPGYIGSWETEFANEDFLRRIDDD